MSEGRRRGERGWRPSALEHWVAFCTGRPAADGWKPTTRYRLVAGLLFTCLGVSVVWTAADRGVLIAVALAAVFVMLVWSIASGRIARAPAFAARHPYLDAAWSIPIAALFCVVVLPQEWPTTRLLAIASAYVAVIYLGAWRSARRRRTRSHRA